MPMTTRGYPYETGADEPGHSLTGGSSGAAPILAQVVDADVGAIAARVTAAEAVNDSQTADIASLNGQVSDAASSITALDGRVSATEVGLAALGDGLTAHEDATTSVHGITDTANLVYTDDARLSDAREPTAHAATHAAAGSDPITPAAIGAYPDTGGTIGGDVDVAGALAVAGINGLEGVRIVGRTATPGAPASGAFVAGDIAIDTAGVWHLCTADGTPGTWT